MLFLVIVNHISTFAFPAFWLLSIKDLVLILVFQKDKKIFKLVTLNQVDPTNFYE